jgi:hypothetical protein
VMAERIRVFRSSSYEAYASHLTDGTLSSLTGVFLVRQVYRGPSSRVRSRVLKDGTGAEWFGPCSIATPCSISRAAAADP